MSYVDVPDTLIDVIRSWTGPSFDGITTDHLVPSVCLKKPNPSGEESGSDDIEKAGGDDQEELESGRCTAPFMVRDCSRTIDAKLTCTTANR